MAIPVPSDPSIATAHLAELAHEAGDPDRIYLVLLGAQRTQLKFACTPSPCQYCAFSHRVKPSRSPAPTAAARYSFSLIVDGRPHRFLACTQHAGWRVRRVGQNVFTDAQRT